jgi:hypothetical protein
MMVFGDAKQTLGKITAAMKGGGTLDRNPAKRGPPCNGVR